MQAHKRLALRSGLLALSILLCPDSIRSQDIGPILIPFGNSNTPLTGEPAAVEATTKELVEYASYFGGTGPDAINTVRVAGAEELARLPGYNPNLGDIVCVGGQVSAALPLRSWAGKRDAFVGCVQVDGTPIWWDQIGSSEDDEVRSLSLDEGIVQIAVNLGAEPVQYGNSGLSGVVNLLKGKKECAVVAYDLFTGESHGRTFISSEEDDVCSAVRSDGLNVWVAGYTLGDFDVQNAWQDTRLGGADGFVAGLSFDLSIRHTFSYVSAEGSDGVFSLDLANSGRWGTNPWGNTGDWKLLVGGSVSGNGLPITDNAFQRFHAGFADTYVQVIGYDRENPTQIGLNYSSLFGSVGADVLVSARWNFNGGFGMAWQTRSPGINTVGRTYNGADDGILAFLAGPSTPPIKRYIGPSSTLNRPYTLEAGSFGTWNIGGYSSFPGAGGGWTMVAKADLTTLANVLTGTESLMTYASGLATWPHGITTVGTTYGGLSVTPNAFQSTLADAPDGYLQCINTPYTFAQIVNLSDRNVTARLGSNDLFSLGPRRATAAVPAPWSSYVASASGQGLSMSATLDFTARPAWSWSLIRPNRTTFDSYFVDDLLGPSREYYGSPGTLFALINLRQDPFNVEITDDSPQHAIKRIVGNSTAGTAVIGRLESNEVLQISSDSSPSRQFRFSRPLAFQSAGKADEGPEEPQIVPYLVVIVDAEAASKSANDYEVLIFDETGTLVETVEVTDTRVDVPAFGAPTLDTYPLPATNQITFRYHLETDSEVRLEVFDIAGRRVTTLVEGHSRRGTHEVVWDGETDMGVRVPGGVYMVRVQSGSHRLSRPIFLLQN